MTKLILGITAIFAAFAISVGLAPGGQTTPVAEASVVDVRILSPTFPGDYGSPPTSVTVTFEVDVSHTDPYAATIFIGPYVQQSFFYPSFPGGSTQTLTETVVIPDGTPAGTYDLTVRVDEFCAFCGYDDEDTEAGVITIGLPAACAGMTFDKTILGSDGNDTISGTGLRELIYGLGGNDTINGGSGNDCIVGGDGNDRLGGGSGNDRVYGGAGNDTINGDSGIDIANGGTGSDSCDAENETACES